MGGGGFGGFAGRESLSFAGAGERERERGGGEREGGGESSSSLSLSLSPFLPLSRPIWSRAIGAIGRCAPDPLRRRIARARWDRRLDERGAGGQKREVRALSRSPSPELTRAACCLAAWSMVLSCCLVGEEGDLAPQPKRDGFWREDWSERARGFWGVASAARRRWRRGRSGRRAGQRDVVGHLPLLLFFARARQERGSSRPDHRQRAGFRSGGGFGDRRARSSSAPPRALVRAVVALLWGQRGARVCFQNQVHVEHAPRDGWPGVTNSRVAGAGASVSLSPPCRRPAPPPVAAPPPLPPLSPPPQKTKRHPHTSRPTPRSIDLQQRDPFLSRPLTFESRRFPVPKQPCWPTR
jgi:hypothetical protein